MTLTSPNSYPPDSMRTIDLCPENCAKHQLTRAPRLQAVVEIAI